MISARRGSSQIKVMLDSGAFSAWTRGETLDLGDYINFLKRYQFDVDTYINLDVIPGKRGIAPTTREVDYAAQASLENYEAMLAAGLKPIPVFHYGENFRWLEKLMMLGADYICLGGTVGLKTPLKRKFLDDCFTMLTNARGEPLVRVHGLGVTEAQFVMRYPWHSVDSTSWMIAPIYGNILIPAPMSGSFSTQIWIGGGERQRGSISSSKNFENLSESAQQHVREFAAACGCTLSDLRNDVYSRMVVFTSTLLLMQEHVARRFGHRRGSFAYRALGGKPRIKPQFHIILAGNMMTNPSITAVLRRSGARHCLRSYYEYKNKPDSFGEHLERLNTAAPYDLNARRTPRVDWKSLNYHDHRRRLLVARNMEGLESEP